MKWLYQQISFILISLCIHSTMYAGQKTLNLQAPDYKIKQDGQYSKIDAEEYGWIDDAGAPKLPGKILSIHLPEGATDIDVHISSVSYTALSGQYLIEPIAPMVPASSDAALMSEIQTHYLNKRLIYQQDMYYPEICISWTGVFYHNKTPVVQIKFNPFRYHPLKQTLEKVENADLIIHYQDPASYSLKSIPERNFQANQNEDRQSLCIIGPESVKSRLDPYLFWKACLGYQATFISVDSILQEVEGQTQAEKIRRFLQEKYQNGEVDHVLLIGHRDKIPYQKLYPNPDNHTPAGGIPSDFYYAQLSGSWDGDEDGYPGEYNDDQVDLIAELNIGRIPFSEPDVVSAILNKIIQFEKDNGTWKQSALLAGAISNYKNENHSFEYYVKTDGAVLMEKIKSDIFSSKNVRTLYEKEGSAPSDCICDDSLNRDNFISSWAGGMFGCLSWFSHGSYNALKRKWWQQDNGNEVPESTEIQWQNLITISDTDVNTQYQPIIFASACDNGWPERTSLARQLIRIGASAIVAASREAFATLGWQEVQDGGAASLSYYFWQHLVQNGYQVGKALKSAREDYQSICHGSWLHLNNLYAFNLYGDPSTRLDGDSPLEGGCEIHISSDLDSSDYEMTLMDGENEIIWQAISTLSCHRIYPLSTGNYTITAKANGIPNTTADMYVSPGQMESIELALKAPAPAKLKVNQPALDLEINEGDTGIVHFKLQNEGEQILTGGFSLIPVCWLCTSEDTFCVDPGSDKNIHFMFLGRNMQSGVYNTQFSLFSNDPQNSECMIPVTLTVNDYQSPAEIKDFKVIQMNNDSLQLSWKAVGDNGYQGQVSMYRIQAADDSDRIFLEIPADSMMAGVIVRINVPVQLYRGTPSIQVAAIDNAGNESLSNEAAISIASGIASHSVQPEFYLYPNFPNPFNMQTSIRFSIADFGPVAIYIFNERGRLIRKLMDESKPPGIYTVLWDGTDSHRKPVPSGIYLIRLQENGFTSTHKMTLLK